MKKILSNLFLLLVWACITLPITSACYSEYNPNDNIATTTNKYAYVPDGINTITIDSCQYIIFVEGHRAGIAHKGNCIYCKKRKREYTRQLLKQLK
jgi:hypothetical protein